MDSRRGSPSKCYNCGKEGHFARECKTSRARGEDKVNAGDGRDGTKQNHSSK